MGISFVQNVVPCAVCEDGAVYLALCSLVRSAGGGDERTISLPMAVGDWFLVLRRVLSRSLRRPLRLVWL